MKKDRRQNVEDLWRRWRARRCISDLRRSAQQRCVCVTNPRRWRLRSRLGSRFAAGGANAAPGGQSGKVSCCAVVHKLVSSKFLSAWANRPPCACLFHGVGLFVCRVGTRCYSYEKRRNYSLEKVSDSRAICSGYECVVRRLVSIFPCSDCSVRFSLRLQACGAFTAREEKSLGLFSHKLTEKIAQAR